MDKDLDVGTVVVVDVDAGVEAMYRVSSQTVGPSGHTRTTVYQ